MAGNSNLHDSRSNRTDEFYTQLSTIEDELRFYREYFKDKVVFCNADDPAFSDNNDGDHFGDGMGGYTSNFFRYFKLNFKQLGLKKLIATHFDPNKPTYKLELTGDINNDGEIDDLDVKKTPLEGNGDFRSPECVELLDEADIVVTNPPFSLMKEYIPLMFKHNKQFLVLANFNHVTFNEIFPYFMEGKMWCGQHSGHFWFRVPDYYENKKTDFKIDDDGQKWRRLGNICWFTNMDIDARHAPLDLVQTYNPQQFPTYDNIDAIEVSPYRNIPKDYYGAIGVPVSYLGAFCKEQFKILGKFDSGSSNNIYDLGKPTLNGRPGYKRIAIQRIMEEGTK